MGKDTEEHRSTLNCCISLPPLLPLFFHKQGVFQPPKQTRRAECMGIAPRSTKCRDPSEPLGTTRESPHAHSSLHQLDSQLPQPVLKPFFMSGNKRKSILCRREHKPSGRCSTGDSFGCVSSSSVCSFGQKELLPAMTHFTQDLLNKAKFGEFSVSHHPFDPETPEDVMGASAEQPRTAQVTKDSWAGPELCSVCG